MAEELAGMEARAGTLQTELAGAGEDLRAELEAERQARWLAEAELARERQRSVAPSSEAELRTLRAELDRAREVAAEHSAASEEARGIIADLTSAAERLRSETPPVDEEGGEGAEAEEAEAQAEAEAAAEAIASRRARTTDHGSADEAPEPPPSMPSEPAATPAESPAGEALAPRVIASRPSTPWLARAIERLAQDDPATAARLVIGLVPAQRLRFDGELTYDLTVTELGTFRVLLPAGSVDPLTEPGPRKDVDFHLEGTAAALAEFAAGGSRKRAKATHFDGSRRRLKKLLRVLRDPVQLADAARAGAPVDPGVVLAALAAATDGEQTAGHTFTVAWDVSGPLGGIWTVHVAGGRPRVDPGGPEGGATATVHVSQAAFLPLLAGFAPPPGEQATVTGNAHAVALLRQWFDAAQGLS